MDSEKQEFEKVEQADELMNHTIESKSQPINEDPSALNILVQPNYAGFWIRFWAYLLDLVVIGSINGILVYPIFRMMDLSMNDVSMFAPISISTAVIFYIYFVLMTKFFGQTLGKMVFGLKVMTIEYTKLNWSTVLFREWIGRFISGSILILYIVVGFLPKKQGIHDLFANTIVIHERS